MAIDRKRFMVVFLVSNLLFAGALAGIVSGGVALAVPTAGVGGFTVSFDELQGEGFEQYPTLEDNSDCAAYPSSVAEIESGTIEGLHLYKDVHVPDAVPAAGGDTIRMSIESDETVEFQGLTQKFTHLEGDLSFEDGQQIGQEPSGDIEEQFAITSPSLTIQDGRINAQSQFVEQISLDGSSVSMDHNPDEVHEFPESPCIAENGSDTESVTGDTGSSADDDSSESADPEDHQKE